MRFLDIPNTELLFAGHSTNLSKEDDGKGEIKYLMQLQKGYEMKEAAIHFGKGHEDEKVFDDLQVRHPGELGPRDGIVSGGQMI